MKKETVFIPTHSGDCMGCYHVLATCPRDSSGLLTCLYPVLGIWKEVGSEWLPATSPPSDNPRNRYMVVGSVTPLFALRAGYMNSHWFIGGVRLTGVVAYRKAKQGERAYMPTEEDISALVNMGVATKNQ